MKKVLAIITARGGSKGIVGKNLAMLAGRPLIGWTLEAAASSQRLDRIIVSTDDTNIARYCREWGIETPFERPPELAGDDSPHIGVIRHALDWLATHDGYKPDYVLLLQPTSPLRTSSDIDAIIEETVLSNSPASVSVCLSHDHPYLARKLGEDGALCPFVAHELAYPRRQDLPTSYVLNGALYLVRRDVFLASRSLEPKGTRAFVMPADRSLQVDTPWDLRLCEWALRESGRMDCAQGVSHDDPFLSRLEENAVFGSAYSRAEEIEAVIRRRSER